MARISDPAGCLAVFGTASGVGKSIVVTALCRIAGDLGLSVAPFKAQNMSNNSFVTVDGLEMGRAQIVQAQAARVEPCVDMNPVLLKPCSDTGSQVVLHGKPLGNKEAREYFGDTDFLFGRALESLNRLRRRHSLIVMEGAGSCAEVNLRSRDFVNFRIAHAADAPVLLVADIDRGGVFAQLVGSLEVMPDEDRSRVKGFIINRFRGDASLFSDGIDYIEKRTGVDVLGLVPYFYHIEIESEDGLPLDCIVDPPTGPEKDKINIAVLRLPHISNFTDFAQLARESAVSLHYLARPRPLDGYDLVLLPGAKNVRFDVEWLRGLGWDSRIRAYVKRGGRLGGICGGYQMLGKIIRDPLGIEGDPGDTPGLDLLPVESELQPEKVLCRSIGVDLATGAEVTGYEIHMGTTGRPDHIEPAVRVRSRNDEAVDEYDGARSPDGRIWGTYFHGLFDSPDARAALLDRLNPAIARQHPTETRESLAAFRERQYDLLAEHFRAHLDLWKLSRLVGIDLAS